MQLFKKTDSTYRERWGYSFNWTDEHLSDDEIKSLRAHHDELGSAVLEELLAISARGKLEAGEVVDTRACPMTDMYTVLEKHHHESKLLREFWNQLHTIPEWVDLKQIERGQKFFGRYAVANSTAFALQGFIRENSASPGIAEVFARTGGFAIKNLLSRVIETFTWVVQVTTSLESITPGGEGHTSTIRVRLLHASVRQRIMKLAHSRPGYFDLNKHGAPVNDLDSMHAISLFCCMPMWDSFPKMGIYPSRDEITDFIALFRYIAYLTGTPEIYWKTPEKSRAVMETMFLYELQPSKTSKILAHNFITWLEDSPPVFLSRGFLEAGCRWLNGHEMSDALGLGRPGVYYYCVFAGHNILVASMARIQKLLPALDEYLVKKMRHVLYSAVTDHAYLMGGKSPFDFKFVPQLDTFFGKETDLSETQGNGRLKHRRKLEDFLFGVFVMTVLFGLVLAYAAVHFTARVVGRVDFGDLLRAGRALLL